MGKGIVFIVFAIGFIVFLILKVIFVGAKVAYDSVFDPNSRNEKILLLIDDCKLKVSHEMYAHKEILGGARLLRLMNMVQDMIFQRGYGKVEPDILYGIVCQAMLEGKHATENEIKLATEELAKYIHQTYDNFNKI